MTWRLEIVHQTIYDYKSRVASSYNEARMTPESDRHQTVVTTRFDVDPATSVRRYLDYWQTRVTEFEISEPHDRLAVTSTSIVETEPPREPPRGSGWGEFARPDRIDQFSEFLSTSTYVAEAPELVEKAHQLVAASADPVDAVLGAGGWINETMSYETGVTGVHTSAVDAWTEKRGVCQDFAHVVLVMLRAMGIPSRYVSGYLHPSREAEIGEPLTGESHAWVEAWTGSWWGFDPTNLEEIGHRHVAIARGRDYSDVAPMRGVHSGGGESRLTAEVNSTRLV